MNDELQGCDDCGDCGLQTVLDASLPAGDYVLAIDGFNHAEGNYSVTMNCPGQITESCCTTRPCQCESVPDACTVYTDYDFAWVDIATNAATDPTITRINNGDWTQNDDDGWFTIPDIGFDFHWFGRIERAITIGTNGVLTFGAGQLPYGSSEPVPCAYGDSGCAGANHDASGVPIEGVIAPLWCDLNPSTADGAAGEGVFFQIVTEPDPRLVAWNKLIVEYQVTAFGQTDVLNFEVILFGDGSVVFQYQNMPADSGSWSEESIGFEDQSGAMGVQILFDAMPDSQSAYRIPPSCHVIGAFSEVPTCCSSLICQCAGVEASCEVDTNYPFEWVDIITSTAGTRIADTEWTQNADDGWFHIDLPFDFHWFGQTERRITIGTNGVLTFGSGQLPFGSSEPVPCAYGGTGCTNAVVVDGVIAPMWCDLNPATATAGEGEGVYYQIISDGNAMMESFNKLIVEYQVETFTSAGSEQHQDHSGSQGVHFEVILFGDGSVLFQYAEMPAVSGSWSLESIGFEDHSGSMGVQILFGTVPDSNTAYMIPASCHAVEPAVTGFLDGTMSCGDTVTGSTVSAGSHLGNGASDHIYSFSLSADQPLWFVQFDSCDSTFDTWLRVFDPSLSTELAGCDDCGPCGTRTVLEAQLPPGDYNFVVEGFSSSEGDYSVTMTCDRGVDPSSLPMITCGETVTGSTVGAGSHIGNGAGEIL